MAFFSGTIFAESLQMNTEIRIIIPQHGYDDRKVLYLLHGLSDNSSAWTRLTRIEQYAERHNYTVIMPEVQRSFYTDMKYGGKYFTYIADELPKICEKLFGIKHERNKTFVAGLSMGGYGALKCGMSRPNQYAACASFSGAVDFVAAVNSERAKWIVEIPAYYGSELTVPDDDNVFKLSEKVDKLPANEKPRVFVSCGAQDFLIESNRKYKQLMDSLDFDFQYMEWKGEHNWDFWDKSVQYALDFFDQN